MIKMRAAKAMRIFSPKPKADVKYPAPVKAATGAPKGTDMRKNQPTNDPVRAPKASVTKWETPPALGYLADRIPIDKAIGKINKAINPQANSEAGPAISAASPGTINIPDPSTALIYKAMACGIPIDFFNPVDVEFFMI
ncbi:hypothetical protein D3C81_1447860 [compost metagenome]